MAAPTYGTTNPRALEPWAIENTLAPLAYAGDRSQLQSELQSYQTARNTAEGQYGIQQEQQHQFAKQQLAQQLYEAKLKEIAPIGKLPGGGAFLSQMPGMEGLGTPESWGGLAQAGNIAQGAENFMHAGAGFRDFSEGGWLQNPQQIPGMAGAEGNLTDNSRVRAELIKQQTSLANAAAKAGKGPMVTLSTATPGNAEGDVHNLSEKVPASQVEQKMLERDAMSARRRAARGGDATSLPPNPDATSAPSSGSGASSSTTASPASAPAKPATAPLQLDTNSPNGKKAQAGAIKTVQSWDDGGKAGNAHLAFVAKDAKDGMRTPGVYNTQILPTGQLVVKGKSGANYPIGN